MLTGLHWWPCVLGLIFMTAALISILVFLAYAWKNREDLSQRILNVLFTKLAISNFFASILLGIGILLRQSGMTLSNGLKVFAQSRIFSVLTGIIIILELSVCSLLRLFSPRLYMWASLHIPHTAYTVIQAFLIVIIQYLCVYNSGIENAQDVQELEQLLFKSIMPVVGMLLGIVTILHVILILRSTLSIY